ncbi:MAG: T9SS type A sorting domain-containing protein [Bacteroidales bacterium]
MKNKYFLTFALAIASIGLLAQNTPWSLMSTTAAEGDWNADPSFWKDGVAMTIDLKAQFNASGDADCIVTDSAHCSQLVMGDGGNYAGVLYVKDGGVLTTHKDGAWSAVGYKLDCEMIIEAGGVVNALHRFHVGLVNPDEGVSSTAILEVAGTLNVLVNKFTVNDPGNPSWTAETYVTTGGVINTPDFDIGDGGLVDVTGGMIVIGRNMKDELAELVTAGKLTAEGGSEEPTIEWQITGSGEEADTATIVKSSSTVGVFDNKVASQSSIGVYPNPASDVVYFKESVVDNVQVYSITGAVVLRRSNVSQLNIESLKPGYYIIKSESNRRTYIDKLLVK